MAITNPEVSIARITGAFAKTIEDETGADAVVVDSSGATIDRPLLGSGPTDLLSGAPGLSSIWEPDTQPHARGGAGSFVNAQTATATEFYAIWDDLMADFPEYISRTSLGLDESGTYPIYRYDFTPAGYDRTVLAIGAIHGSEVTGSLGLYRTLYEMCHNWRTIPQLALLRHQCRIVVVPFANPWGSSQAPRKRQNSNGVDVNRNFNYKWADFVTGGAAPFDFDYKGPSAASEVETQYLQDLIDELDADFLVDCHNFGNAQGDYPCYLPPYNGRNQHVVLDTVAALKRAGETSQISASLDLPLSINYASAAGTPAANLEFSDTKYSPTATVWDETEITEATRWMGNVLRAAGEVRRQTRGGSLIMPEVGSRLIKELRYSDASFTSAPLIQIPIGSGSIAQIGGSEAGPLYGTCDCPGYGEATFQIWMTVRMQTSAAFIAIRPWIYQHNGIVSAAPNIAEESVEVIAQAPAADSRVFVCAAALSIPTVPTNETPAVPGKLRYGVNGYCSSGTAYIVRFRGQMVWTAGTRSDRVEHYKATKVLASPAPDQVKAYPA